MCREAGMVDIQAIDEMMEAYSDEWVFLADCENDESGNLLRGRVVAHSPDRDDVYREMADYSDDGGGGYFAVKYFGEVPADIIYML